ncbi:pyrroline-5-carboxylate reductase [Bremerella cremea]|uniref:Pyrroline-5-carboxylate reductase n=1 Tax=Bremerella cremea TaxID=1031537 RepID=A0A368KPD6_9BACT|nr:pyrroline-5-carboxylate reductase [Bremerella cremea]RCS42152.1 pyrroline-5-carboxylate reductase [Bremerella cremea]
MTNSSLQVGFIGAGQMAQAMARGFVDRGGIEASAILASDPYPEALQRFEKAIPGCLTTDDNQAVIGQSDIVILAVKPQMMQKVAESISDIPSDCLLVSIAAGITLSKLNAIFPTTRIIRVMPNTPCLVGVAACGYSASDDVDPEDIERTQQLLESSGIALQVPEKLLDAVTGLSGSGPAFIYMLIEAMSDAGVRQGLPRDAALQLAAQTVKGAAEMVLATGEHPGALKDKVTSPGGTTIAGVYALEKAGFRGAVMDAISAAAARSRELGLD